MIFNLKIKGRDEIYKVERIDFFKKKFVAFYQKEGHWNVNSNDIEYISNSQGEVIYPNKNYFNHFADAIIKSLTDFGVSKEDAEQYFIKNYT